MPEPPCFTHPDGALRDNPKSNVYKILKGMVNTEVPQNSNTVISDGMFPIQSTSHCLNYSIFLQKNFSFVLKLTQHRADLYFDVYESPSIKDTKRKERGNEEFDRNFSTGPKTKMETDMHDLLRISCFKEDLLRFFFKEIEDQIYAPIIGSQLVYIATDNKCKNFFCVNGKLCWESVDELYGYHLEPDTRIVFHVKHADINDPGQIVVRANDTDVVIIFLANINLFSAEVWYESGLDYNNAREYLSITKLKLTVENPEAWIGLYSFLGNAYTPAFCGKGKVQPINFH